MKLPLRFLNAEHWQSSLARGYLVIGLTSCLVLAASLNARAAGPWAFLPALVGSVGLAARWPSAPVFVLLGTAIAVMVSREAEYGGLDIFQMLMAASLLGYSISQSRLVGLTRSHWPPDSRSKISWTPPLMSPPTVWAVSILDLTLVYPLWQWYRNRPLPPVGERRNPDHASADELTYSLITPALSLAVAFVMWLAIGALPVPLLAIPEQWHVGIVVWILIGSAIGVRVLINCFALYRMSDDEARMILADELWRETRREQRRVARWTAWRRLVQASRDLRRSKA